MASALKALVLAALLVGAAYWALRPTPAPSRPHAHAIDTRAAAAAPLAPEPDTREMPAVVPLPTIGGDAATSTAPAASVSAGAAPGAAPEAMEVLVARLLPAVVRIETESAIGTGFFVKPDTILTNAHVVQGNATVTIRRASGSTTTARVETKAPGLDLAVLTVSGADATQPTIALGSGTAARQGQEVLALGSPLGLQNTVTRGIVSAVREIGGVRLVQTDAAINPGNSGGPLVDRTGVAIGITSMGVRAGVAQGLSFAIAIDHAADLLAGKRTDAADTPLAALTHAMQDPPRAAAGADAEAQRGRAAQAFEQSMAALAQRADALDDYWKRFMASCYQGRVEGTFDRAWFALYDARAMRGSVAPGCGASFDEVRQRANEIRDEVRAADERARQGDVYPGTRRDARRRYHLDYAGWGT